jgi:hypothetical protein
VQIEENQGPSVAVPPAFGDCAQRRGEIISDDSSLDTLRARKDSSRCGIAWNIGGEISREIRKVKAKAEIAPIPVLALNHTTQEVVDYQDPRESLHRISTRWGSLLNPALRRRQASSKLSSASAKLIGEAERPHKASASVSRCSRRKKLARASARALEALSIASL